MRSLRGLKSGEPITMGLIGGMKKKKCFEFEDFFNGFHSSYIEGTLVFKMSCRFTVLDLK